MHFVNIHHLMIVYLLINNVFLAVLLSQGVLVLLIIALLSISAPLLWVEEFKVNSRFLTVLDDHFELIWHGQDLEGFHVERSGFEQPFDVAMIFQFFVHSVEVEPRKAAVRGFSHPVLDFSNHILVGLCLNAGLWGSHRVLHQVFALD